MKTLLPSAFALTALGSIALAEPDPPSPAPVVEATDSDWARLDREIGELSRSLNRRNSGTNVGGLVRSYFQRSADAAYEQGTPNNSVNSGNNLGGFQLFDVEIFAEGTIAEYDWRINLDLRNGAAILEDAYARWNMGGGFNLLVGQFKPPTSRSASIDSENLVLVDRTYVGQILDYYDPGVMVTGDWKHFGAFAAVQNGADGRADEFLFATRGEYRLNGGTGRVEGAFGAPSNLAATAGLFWLQDSSATSMSNQHSHLKGADLSATFGPVGGHVEVVNFEGELLSNGALSKTVGDPATPNGDVLNFFGATSLPLNYAEGGAIQDVTIWSATASFLVEAIDVELAARVQVYDDPGNTRSATIGANWYRSGKNAVWHVGVTQVRSNDPNAPNALGNGTPVNGVAEGVGDGTLFQIGLSLGRSTSTL